MRAGRRWWSVLLALTAAGCGGQPPAASATVELTGGRDAGKYRVAVMPPACTRGATAPGSREVQLSDWRGPRNGLRSLQLVLPAPARPEEFYLGMVFGDLFLGTVHEIETRPGAALPRRGRGTVTVTTRDGLEVLSLTGMTPESVAVTATITCRLPAAQRKGVRR